MTDCAKKTLKLLGWVVLLGWPLLIVNRGIDVTDVSYYLSNYKYAFSDVGFTMITTMLSSAVGGILFSLFESHQLLMLSIAGWCLYVCFILLSYWILRKYIPSALLLPMLLAGSMLYKMSIIIVSYNSLSFTTFLLGAALIILALQKDSIKLIWLAGIALGTNVFFRFPNLLHWGLVAIIFWYYAFCMADVKMAVKRSFVFLSVAVVSAAAWLGIGIGWLGWDSVHSTIFGTANLAVEADSSYNLMAMIVNVVSGWTSGLVATWRFMGNELLVLLLLAIICRCFRLRSLRIIPVVLIPICLLMGWHSSTNLFYVQLMSIVAVTTLILGIFGAVYFCKRQPMLSVLFATVSFITFIVPFGTNNGMYHYPVMSPFILAGWATIVYTLTGLLCNHFHLHSQWAVLPIVFFMGISLTVGLNQGVPYVYRDAPLSQLTSYTQVPAYKGMKTTLQRATTLDNIYLALMPFQNMELAYIGEFAAGAVVSDMRPFFEKAWPDLQSYPIEQFEDCINRKSEMGIYPVILIADIDGTGTYRDIKKIQMLLDFADKEGYEVFRDEDYYQIYLPPPAIDIN